MIVACDHAKRVSHAEAWSLRRHLGYHDDDDDNDDKPEADDRDVGFLAGSSLACLAIAISFLTALLLFDPGLVSTHSVLHSRRLWR